MVNQKTVILADDDRTIRGLLRATISGLTSRVLEASDGTEALAMSQQECPDLIVLDIGMPGLDGFEGCTALKRDRETAGIKVLMVTARSQADDRERGLQLGADGYMTKPFSPVGLLSTVEKLLAV